MQIGKNGQFEMKRVDVETGEMEAQAWAGETKEKACSRKDANSEIA
jgi:hypothetical protein